MSIFNGTTPSYDVTRPNQRWGKGDPLADVTEQFTGTVEGSFKHSSLMHGFVPVRSVRGTSTISNRGISKAKLQAIVPGVTPAPSTEPNTSKIFLKIDTVILARNAEPMLDEFQSDYDYQQEVAREQGIEMSKMYDQTFFIQAAKAGMAKDSPYGTDAQMPGHKGGNAVTLANANDYKDPAKLYKAISDLVTSFLSKGVRPNEDGLMMVLPPESFTALMQSEYIVNGNYVTSAGVELNSRYIFAAWGMPVVTSNDAVCFKKVENHLLSNASNGMAYDGDFTKVCAQVFSPRALLAGSTIDLQSKIFFDDLSKLWFIDSWTAYGVTVNRPEYAGVLMMPAA